MTMRILTAAVGLLLVLVLGLGTCFGDEAWKEETPPTVILVIGDANAAGASDLAVTPDWEQMQEERDTLDTSPDLALRTEEGEAVLLWGSGDLVDPFELLEQMRGLEAYHDYQDIEHPPYRLQLRYEQAISPAGRQVSVALEPEGEGSVLLAHLDISADGLIRREILPGFSVAQVVVDNAEPNVVGASSIRYWLPVEIATSDGQWSMDGGQSQNVTHDGTTYDVHVYRSLRGGPGTDPNIAFEGAGYILSLTLVSVSSSSVQPVVGATLDTWQLPYGGAFPAGIALDPEGRVYTAVNGGLEVYRLDPVEGLYRSWGVGERPDGVAFVEGATFCTVRDGNAVVYFDPDSLGVTTAILPFEAVGPGEIHRGPYTDDGNVIFWIVERTAAGLLRFEYDLRIDAPGIYGEQWDQSAERETTSLEPRIVESTYERFAYEVAYIPSPFTLDTRRDSPPFTEWSLPFADVRVEDIAPTADGKVWISAGLPTLFLFDPAEETLQEMETAQNVYILQGLLADADGSIWYGDLLEGSIGHFDPTLGISEVWRIPGASEVFDLAFDNEGAIWYTDRIGDTVGKLDPATNQVRIYSVPPGSEPLYLEIGTDGAVWFTAGSGNYIGRLKGEL